MVRNRHQTPQPEAVGRSAGTRHPAEERPADSDVGKGVSLALCNEPAFMNHLEQALSTTAQGQSNVLMQVDVCRAHDIRETLGKEALDAVQALVEDIVREQLGPNVPAWMRPQCALSLLLMDTSPQTAAAQARKVLACIDDKIFHWKEHPFRLGAHVGLVELGEPGIPTDGWLILARQTCKAAEELGGSGIRLVSRGAQAWRDLEQDRDWHDHLAEII